MLKYIFGNATAERVLLHIYHYGSIHAAAIASDYGLAVTPILNQLERFEKSGILIAKTIGKSRVYSFNPKTPFAKPIKELLKIAYESIPLEEREAIFKIRRRPRSKGKPVIYGI
ncbi:MAG: hypothetical protein FWH22_09705 [Fibromonadales bacterium]|nr:hypothetical protein [Fibromonadales bacterium]